MAEQSEFMQTLRDAARVYAEDVATELAKARLRVALLHSGEVAKAHFTAIPLGAVLAATTHMLEQIEYSSAENARTHLVDAVNITVDAWLADPEAAKEHQAEIEAAHKQGLKNIDRLAEQLAGKLKATPTAEASKREYLTGMAAILAAAQRGKQKADDADGKAE